MTGAPLQTYRERRPAAALAPYLTCVWVQWVAADAEPYHHSASPNGSVDLLCELGTAPRVSGPQTQPVSETLAPGTTVVGVRFRPGAAPAVLGLPASELVDLSVDADELLGTRLGDELAECDDAAAAIALLERAVVARLARGSGAQLDPVVTEAVARLGEERDVGSLPASLYISERQLRRRCVATIGVGPKSFQRMLRFQRFLALAHTSGLDRPDLAWLAAAAGYADQPHLTRESLRLGGKPPGALLADAYAHCAGVHDHAASFAPLLRARATA